jgi:putative ABC transport system permease protein
MHFLDFVLRNILRRKVRSALTGVGVAVAIAAVVALTGISSGFEQTATDIYKRRGVDMVVVRAGVAERMNSTLNEQFAARIARIPYVKAVDGSLTHMISLGDGGLVGVPVHGWPANALGFNGLKATAGEKFGPGARKVAMLGKSLAENLKKKPGDDVEIEGETFKVAGIFDSFNVYENGSAVVPIRDLQELMDQPGQVNEFQIVLDESAANQPNVNEEVARRIESLKDEAGHKLGLAAMPTQQYISGSTELRFSRAMAWVTSTIALVIGAVGMLNTMIMSVMDRTQEIGVLRAIGWRKSRIVRMILWESLLISLIGAVLGTMAAIALTRFLYYLPAAQGFVRHDLPLSVIGLGLLMSVVVGLIGGAYPALRGANLPPTEALRYE